MPHLMTEKEANTKRCLMLELIQSVHASAAPGGSDSPVGCIGSGCMWWRGAWRKKVTDRSCWDKEELASKPTAPGKDWERIGYCGLAGKP